MNILKYKKQIPYLKITLIVAAAIILCIIGNFFWQKKIAHDRVNSALQLMASSDPVLRDTEDEGCKARDAGFIAREILCQVKGTTLHSLENSELFFTTQNSFLAQGWKETDNSLRSNAKHEIESGASTAFLELYKGKVEARLFYQRINAEDDINKLKDELWKYHGMTIQENSLKQGQILIWLYVNSTYWQMPIL